MRLSSAVTMRQGAMGVCVLASISSRARVYASQRAMASSSTGLRFHCLSGDVRREARRFLLFPLADVEVVFDDRDPRAHQHVLELRDGLDKQLMLFAGTEAHHVFDACPVVPAAIEEHELLRRRKVRHVPLKVPGAAVAFRRRAERDHARLPRAQVLYDALDQAVLPARIPTLEDDEQTLAALDEVLLKLDQLDLESAELFLVRLVGCTRGLSPELRRAFARRLIHDD